MSITNLMKYNSLNHIITSKELLKKNVNNTKNNKITANALFKKIIQKNMNSSKNMNNLEKEKEKELIKNYSKSLKKTNVSKKDENIKNIVFVLKKTKPRNFALMDFPKDGNDTGDFSGKYPRQAAKKAFMQLARKTGLENKNQKIVVFSIREKGTQNIYTYMGQRVRLARPITVKLGNKNVTYKFQSVVTKYNKPK